MTISIITINYNNDEGLKKTMTSVLEQTYDLIEYIVIDGGSTDGSVEVIEQNNDQLAYSVSEPDKGIYHAMNKGIEKATGAYLLFLNSGDWLVHSKVIENFVAFKPVEDIVYGDPLVRSGKGWIRKYMPTTLNIGTVLVNTLAHQAEFYKQSLFQDGLRYDTSYKCSSDRNLTIQAIIFKNASSRYIDLVVCYFENPGISSDFELRHQERKRYLRENFDPYFLKLLKEYKKQNKAYNKLRGHRIVKIALWLQKRKESLLLKKRI